MAIGRRAKSRNIDFSFEAPQASRVMLAGTFNNWNDRNTPLQKSKNRIWSKSLTLKPGRYEYKFVVDGTWVIDPKNNEKAMSSMGTENSVLEVK